MNVNRWVGKRERCLSKLWSDAALKTTGSYLVQWSLMKWLKEKRFVGYDLDGFNPDTNLRTYRVMRGHVGKGGRDAEFLARFHVADSRLSTLFIRVGELLSCWRTRWKSVRTNARNRFEI
jgi:hypothetical protein